MSDLPANHQGIDRRQLLTRIGMTALLAGPGVSLLSACATSGSSKSSTDKATSKDAKNPFGVDATAPLDVVIFKGGYSDTYATASHEQLYKAVFPGSTIKHEGLTAIGTTLQPRFQSGTDIPDVVDNSGSSMLDFGALAGAGQMTDLTGFWNAPSVDDPNTKISDSVVSGTVQYGYVGGKPLTMPYVATTFGLWYNAALFKEKGWTVPTKWADFVALCGQIKAAGITPVGYGGKNAAYYMWAAILESACKIGGNQVQLDIDNLKAGSWSAAAVQTAAGNWAALFKQYSNSTYQGLIHTQIQTLHKQNKIAFYPCGDWLENEMKDVKGAAGFEYAVMAMPDMGGEQLAYPALRVSPGEQFFVPTHGKNPAGGLEYMRLMLSKAGAQGFYKNAGSMTVVKDALSGVQLSPAGASVAAAQKAAGNNIITYTQFDIWYPDLDQTGRTQVNKLCYAGGNAKSFGSAMDAEAAKLAGDSSTTKQTRTA